VRIALGAQRSSILKMILGKGAQLVATGIVIGLSASYALSSFLASEIWGIPTTDRWTFGAVATVALIVGLAACLLPAHRATTIDPCEALRYE